MTKVDVRFPEGVDAQNLLTALGLVASNAAYWCPVMVRDHDGALRPVTGIELVDDGSPVYKAVLCVGAA